MIRIRKMDCGTRSWKEGDQGLVQDTGFQFYKMTKFCRSVASYMNRHNINGLGIKMVKMVTFFPF